jgi:Ricin-type beta-trefoil lectin domain
MSISIGRSRRARVLFRAGRRLSGVLVATLLGLTGLSVTAGPAHAETWLRLHSYHSGLVANVQGGTTNNGEQIIQWPFHESQWNSQWQKVHVAFSWYQWENRWSHQCLDVRNKTFFTGAEVVQWPCDGSASQRWIEFQHPTLPVVHMRTDASTTYYLTVENGSLDLGARLVMTPYNQALASQMWQRW